MNVTVEDVNLKAETPVDGRECSCGKGCARDSPGSRHRVRRRSGKPRPGDRRSAVAVKELDIRPFQPYVQDKVKVTITDGRLTTTGRLNLASKSRDGLQAKFTGETNLAKFGAIEKATSEDLLRWESLALQELSVEYNPLSIRAKKIALTDFFAHVVVEPNGRLNLQEITNTGEAVKPADQPKPAVAPATTEGAAPAGPTGQKDVQIEAVTLQGGRVQFLGSYP